MKIKLNVFMSMVSTKIWLSGVRCSFKKLSISCGVLLVIANVVTGCAVGPDFQSPASPDVNGYTPEPLALKTASDSNAAGGEAQHFVLGLDIPAQWWTLYESPALNALIERAISANPDVQAAQAALRVAQENVAAQKGTLFPSIDASFTPSRQKVPTGSVTSNATSGATIYSLHTAQVSVSYIPDVFGGNRRAIESQEAQAEYSRFQLQAAYLSLTANVVTTAIQVASLDAQLKATRQIISLESEQLDLLRKQAELGQIAGVGVSAQEAALAQAQAAVPLMQKQLDQQRNLLIALTGRFPSEQLSEQLELPKLRLPQELPVSLPSRLVQQRPDVRAAEAQLHTASALVGVAEANMLPQFTLTAAGGSAATQFSDLFTSGTGFWGIAGGVTQPLFQGGTLLHRKRAAEASYDQSAALYRSTVIAAFQNVADSLRALQLDAESLKAASVAEQATKNNLEIARRQVQLGDISYLALLSSEQAYQQALINRIQMQASRYADTAALFQALGGGWWNQKEPT